MYYFILNEFSFLKRGILSINGNVSRTDISLFLLNTNECFQPQLTELTLHMSLAAHNQKQEPPTIFSIANLPRGNTHKPRAQLRDSR